MKQQILFVLVLCTTSASLLYSQGAAQNTDWPVSNGSPGGSHYSSLKQINRTNVGQLQIAWTFDAADGPGMLETNPIVVNGILYGYTTGQKIFAVNAATGERLWLFDSGELGRGNNRGLSYWRSGSDERIFAGIRQYVYSLNAKTGRPDPKFGDDGRIDFRADLRGGPEGASGALGHPPVIYKDLVIFAGHTSQVLPAAPAPVRAYDARTGKLRWQFNTIPQPGEYGYDTWPKNAWTYTAGAGSWMGMSLDEQRGIVYVPTSNVINIADGRDRPGDNLFGNTLLALDAATGKRIWHFQTVKHDVWDRDITSPPSLITIKRDGRNIDAVAVTTKSGYVWVFDRTNGTPLFPIEYKKYPASTIPGEVLSETQPLPTKPAPFARQLLTADMLTQRTPEAHAEALARFKKMISKGQFVPPSVGVDTVMFPGMDGGGEWGGTAFDPDTELLYVNSNEMAWLYALAENPKPGATVSGKDLYRTNCAVCHGEDRTGAPPGIPSLVDIGKRMSAAQVRSTVFYGMGRMPGFDKATGKLLWEATLPFPGNATPATYEIDGRQFIVIAASGGGVLHNQRNTRPVQAGAKYVAFALPKGIASKDNGSK